MMQPSSNEIRAAAARLVTSAQAVLDDWEQDADGMDPELGAGGACQDVAAAISRELSELGVEDMAEVFTEFDGGHVFVVARLADGVFRIDIPPGIYETGAGYVWRKRPGVRLAAPDLVIDRVEGPVSACEFRSRYSEDPDPVPGL